MNSNFEFKDLNPKLIPTNQYVLNSIFQCEDPTSNWFLRTNGSWIPIWNSKTEAQGDSYESTCRDFGWASLVSADPHSRQTDRCSQPASDPGPERSPWCPDLVVWFTEKINLKDSLADYGIDIEDARILHWNRSMIFTNSDFVFEGPNPKLIPTNQ